MLYVCLGAPAQEKWIYKNRAKLTTVNALLGLGGSLDVYAGTVKRAPKIFIKLGLEWFYRLLCEPWRFKRMLKLPKFYFGTWKHKMTKG
ncbi:MAG: WecB/TagA/CpsF family glycosyltransferase [Clostridia bacterium]|nr:WecB/TagA/CpsF family glycosyltransferase [Clostridia bacterium]